MNWQKILVGAVTGFLVSAVVDLREWLKAPENPDGSRPKFDFTEAGPRWLIGLIFGAATGAGIAVE